ncbi:MAG TPA: selenocysteine-specific translation elongation factor [Noviherbaspirillum sp.]
MIIATAGHVDHGKTLLVRALTGIDTDRLKEEKMRGMSIEPGFAYADLGSGMPIGFVDVPGHERFIRNMLAGVAAVDFALLVVAADDGPMPQTREHLAILELLGIRQGAVALTKIDRVTPERVARARAETVALLASGPLRDAPVFPVAATTGAGMEDLRAHLVSVARAMPSRVDHGNFRLAVDRCFSLSGAGLVVTGAVFSGAIRNGDQVVISPHGVPVRVRDMRVHDRRAEAARAGWRCALNLAGTELRRASIARGDWIVAAPAHVSTERCDVRITLLASQEKPLRHWTPVHLHCGAAAVNARVALLEGKPIAPGSSALAQLVIDRPIGVLRGDRFILRDQSAQQTIAGGTILDPFAPTRGRARPARISYLRAMEKESPRAALEAALEAQPDGVAVDDFVTAWNLTVDEADVLFDQVRVVRFPNAGKTAAVSVSRWNRMREALLRQLQEWHTQHPDGLGPDETALAAGLAQRALPASWRVALASLCNDGHVVREGICVRLATHRPQLSAGDAVLLARVTEALCQAGRRPPVVVELAKLLDMDQSVLDGFLERASRLGHLVRVAKNRYFLPETMAELADIAAVLARESEQGTFEAAAYRDRSGIGRNVTIEVLEFMDRMRMTRYAGGRRRMMS